MIEQFYKPNPGSISVKTLFEHLVKTRGIRLGHANSVCM